MTLSTLDYSAELIHDRHEKPTNPARRLIQHVAEHSADTAHVAQRVALAISPYDRRLELVGWMAGLFHDVEHFDEIQPSGIDAPLLNEKRIPISDGMAEHISAKEAHEYLVGRMMYPGARLAVCDAIYFGTRYTFENGGLRHSYIKEASDPVAAYVTAKADLLNVLERKEELGSKGDPKKMLDVSLRFLMERYPSLAEHIISGSTLADETFDALKNTVLPAFANEEQFFVPDQYTRLEADARGILESGAIERVVAIFDIGTFVTAHDYDGWNEWLSSPEAMTRRLYDALPAVHKSNATS